MSNRLVCSALVVMSLVIGLASQAAAQSCEQPLVGASSTALQLERPARRWHDRWMAIYAVGAVGQGITGAVTSDEGLRVDSWVSAGSSAIGFMAILLSPYPVRRAENRLEGIDDPTERECAATELIERSASAERFGHSALTHVGSAAVALGGSAILWLGYDRPFPALANLVFSLVVGELQIYTMPRGAMRAETGDRSRLEWTPYLNAGGFGIVGSF